MFRKFLIAIIAVCMSSCGATVESFYNNHRNDPGVTALQVPNFMYSALGNLSPEMKTFTSNVSDIRYMNLPVNTTSLSSEINAIVDKGYTDVFRQNMEDGTKLLSVKEKGNRIKEIILYNTNSTSNSLLYFKGNFDPQMINQMAEADVFSNVSGLIDQQ